MYGLSPKTIKDIKSVFKKLPEIDKVILYGSRAKGNYKEGSDIDITLIGSGLNLKTIYKLEDKLDELYLPYIFDISIFNQIDNVNLIKDILLEGKTIYLKDKDELPEVKKLGKL